MTLLMPERVASRPPAVRRPGPPRSFGVFVNTAGEQAAPGRKKQEALLAFARSLQADGEVTRVVSGWRYEPCDVAVMYGTSTARPDTPVRALRNEVAAAHAGHKLILETPFVGRRVLRRPPWLRWARRAVGLERKRVINEFDYFRVGLDGISPTMGEFNNRLSPPDRWGAMSGRLGVRLRPYRRDGRHVLVLGQVPGDASLRGRDVYDWLAETVTALRRLTDRPIVVRPHPASGEDQLAGFERRFHDTRGISLDFPPRGTMQRSLRDCWAVVAFSSSGTVDALLEGIPTIALDRGNVAWPVSDHGLDRIERLSLHPREQWLSDLAYTQWSVEELASGEAWRHLRPVVPGAQDELVAT